MTKAQSGPQPGRPEKRKRGTEKAKRQNDLLDEGLKETFPASDPVSVVRVD